MGRLWARRPQGVWSNGFASGSRADRTGQARWAFLLDTDAFLYRDGAMIDLNTTIDAASGWHLSEAAGINDSGQIVGWGRTRLGNPMPSS